MIGLQWGDEAKGKIVDILTEQHDIVVRYQGGNNAGHTVVCQGQTYKLSLLPVGVLNPRVTSVIGPGVVVNPKALESEISMLAGRGVNVGQNLLISDRAHVIFPYHIAEEAAFERSRGNEPIGTTGRGIGTCYRDKIGRIHAMRVGDLLRPVSFKSRLKDVVDYKNTILKALTPGFEALDAEAIATEYLAHAERFKPHVTDTTSFLHKALANGKRLLFEGAQGSLLDIDHGSFPYVTSSNSSGSGLHNGSGVPERHLTKIIGVVKAYTTRVGGGPFPTELDNPTGEHIRKIGREYGTVTGRPRRCGWFDGVASSYGGRVSGVTCVAIMLLDVLSELDEIGICTHYEINGERTADFPSHVEDLAAAKPVYRMLPGWKRDISGVKKLADFPARARAYIDTIADLMGVPVTLLSVGPDREQTVML